jgi:hypothetical protein
MKKEILKKTTLTKEAEKKLQIKCPVFLHGDFIPAKYTCDGQDINPPFNINGIPGETESMALIVEDPDAPMGTWVHWVVWNIPIILKISEDSSPGIEGMNSFYKNAYGGPCPPSGAHRYFFTFYALDKMLDLPDETDKEGLLKAMSGHILASGEIMGKYKRV